MALICFASLVLSLPGLWVPYFNMDEATNGTFARFINNGDLNLSYYLGDTYILTHYLYAWVYKLLPARTLMAIHVVHAFWKCGTILALYWAGTRMQDKRAGIWAALFYAVYSVAFMSKDFHTPSAESWSLLPATLCAGFVFSGLSDTKTAAFFWAGIFACLATFFKAPAGVILVAASLTIFAAREKWFKRQVALGFGFLVVLLFPVLLVTPFGEGFLLMAKKLEETQSVYIQQYENFSFLYWGVKFSIRSALVFLCVQGMSVFAFLGARSVFRLHKRKRGVWLKIFFICTWFFLIWTAVTLGKRVFYHYYVFLLAPMALIAAHGIRNCDRLISAARLHTQIRVSKFLAWFRKNLAYFMVFSACCGFIDGAFNFSTLPPKLDGLIAYIKKETKQDDPIYVWGGVPQIYFLSDRLPATTFFWSDSLAGTHPGSPAMEYIRATGKSLALHELMLKDFNPRVFDQKNQAAQPLTGDWPSSITENELFTVDEMIDKINNPYWQRVMRDFIKHPPVLFVDTSPTNIRGFGHFPIHNYELLKRFIQDNYEFATSVDGMNIYTLAKPSTEM